MAHLTQAAFNAFDRRVMAAEGRPLQGLEIDTIQVNLGLRCNLCCVHCHVAAGPRRPGAGRGR